MGDDMRAYANILWADAVLKERDAATARAERVEADRNHWRDEYRMIAEHLSAVMREQERAEAENGVLLRKIAEIRAIHQQYRSAWVDYDTCTGCTQGMEMVAWPCPTIAALDGTDNTGGTDGE